MRVFITPRPQALYKAIKNKMKAAQVTQWDETPRYVDLPEPASPGANETQIKVIATGIHRVVRSRASGVHYSATTLPHIPGSDGVGVTVPDKQLVYFSTLWEKGSMAEVVNVSKADITPIKAHGADPVRIAGLVNPAMSSWMALKTRVENPPPNFSVLIMGATSTSGSVALALSRHLGAGKIIGCARNEETMKVMGYDETIALKEPVDQTDFSKAEDVDVILDYVYGPATVQLFKSLKPKSPVQYVQIGTVASPTIELPGDIMRSRDLTIRGAAPGAYTGAQMAEQTPAMIEAITKLDKQKFKIIPLADIEKEWHDMKDRIVVQVSDYKP